jgi:hypothetical protein
MTPHLDHAQMNGRHWCWASGCWREWSHLHADWLPSGAPPAEAQFFNYREHILSRFKGVAA